MDLFSLYIIIILSAVFHEYGHGLMAFELGDPTAKNEGRLTLNPLPHLDLIGTVIVPFLSMFSFGMFIGWAKPVPINPFLFKDRRNGILKVSLAGISANLILAIIFGAMIRFGVGQSSLVAIDVLKKIVIVNISLALFNLLPFPPLDGSKIFYELFPRTWGRVIRLGFLGTILAIAAASVILPSIGSLLFQILTGQFY